MVFQRNIVETKFDEKRRKQLIIDQMLMIEQRTILLKIFDFFIQCIHITEIIIMWNSTLITEMFLKIGEKNRIDFSSVQNDTKLITGEAIHQHWVLV